MPGLDDRLFQSNPPNRESQPCEKKGFPTVYRLIRAMALPLLILGLASTCARADYVFTVPTPTSGPDTLDFTISSSDLATLSAFGLSLSISTVPPSADAYFTPDTSQPTPYSGGDGLPYVFQGQSFGDYLTLPFWSTGGATYPTSISGGDSEYTTTNGFGYVTVTSTSFLASVEYQVLAGTPSSTPVQITLSSSSSYFDDLNGSPLNFTASMSDGVVNINISASAVPEPSSLAMAAFPCLGGLLGYSRLRRRGRSPRSR